MKQIMWLNAHLFWGTLVGTFYRRVLYHDWTRCHQICDYIRTQQPEVVILSEVWGWWLKKRIIAQLKSVYPYHWIPQRQAAWYKLGPEMVGLSRSPISATFQTNFQHLGGWDRFSIKGIYGMMVDGVLYCGTHFDSTTLANQLSNLQQVKNFLQDKSTPVVLMGDFNMGSWEHGEQLLRNELNVLGFSDAYRQVHPDLPGYTCNDNNNPVSAYFTGGHATPERLDYCFIRGNSLTCQQAEVIHEQLSDHYGLLMGGAALPP